jgi:gamma-glutamylcyclotransferase (GGCT)/AIG2-like uncharacterized protein YtfP
MQHAASRSPLTPQPSNHADHPAVGRETLFVYGTLLFPEVVRILIDRVPDSVQAAVEGWRAAALPGRIYPGLVPARKTTNGLLLGGITAVEWQTLDSFEGELYEPRELPLKHGGHGWAYIYLANADAAPEDWDAEWFHARHLTSYLNRCAAWRRWYEAENRLTPD